MAKYFPILMDLDNKPVLIVGGGPIAARKAASLLGYGPSVTIVAREASQDVKYLAANESAVELHERPYEDSDLDEPIIVFAATNDRGLHEHIKASCDERKIACNIVDVTDLCGFIIPSIIRRGELMITISTDGMCPAYSKFQRKRMEECCFGVGCESKMHVVAAARNELKGPLGKGMSDEEKFDILKVLAAGELEGVLEDSGEEAASKLAVERVREMVAECREQNQQLDV